jgi:segregation and condensation protein A
VAGSKSGAAKARRGRARGATDAPPAPAVRAAGSPGRAEPTPIAAAAPEEPSAREGEYVVQLPTFEGPLDLLLHLIQQHELDILDIPVSFVTQKYLEYLKLMELLSIDLASEYLVMAATLAHIKSKMLLPSVPAGQDGDGMPGDEDEDPRAELVRRLLEYQKYKTAAAELGERGTLGRDVFSRGMSESEVPKGPAPFAPTNVFSLLDAFERVLKRANIQLDHEVVFDRISITDRMVELTEKLSGRRAMRFEDLLLDSVSKGGVISRFEVVITFLAVLEMCKLRLIRVHQTDPLAAIYVELSSADGSTIPGAEGDAPVDFASEVAAEGKSAAAAAEASAAAAAEASEREAAAVSESESAAVDDSASPGEGDEVAAGAAQTPELASDEPSAPEPEESQAEEPAEREATMDVAGGDAAALSGDADQGGAELLVESSTYGETVQETAGAPPDDDVADEMERDDASGATAPPDGVATSPVVTDAADAGSDGSGG